jgi:4'-phosphopantetheinyl transferase
VRASLPVDVADPTTAAGELRLWRVDLHQPEEWVERVSASLLTPDERTRGERGAPEVRRRRLVARAALRIALSRHLACTPASLRFVYGPQGKPALAGDDGVGQLHFNLSRSGDCCVIGVSAAGAIGVDVERTVAIPRLEEIAARRFAPSEAAAIMALPGERRVRAFYNCWTRKEAYLKATGAGLTGGLDRVLMTVDERPAILALDDDDPGAWGLLALEAGTDLTGAVVARGARGRTGGAIGASGLPLGPGSSPS